MIIKFFVQYALVLMLGTLNIAYSQESEIKIRIDRRSFSDLCIQGNLFVNEEFIGYSLELPEVGNNAHVSCIPEGTYAGKVRTDGTRGWRLELDYPDRPNVQIHIGNTRDDSRGCILVGSMADAQNCTVRNSGNAMNALKEAFYLGSNSSSRVAITIM